MGFSPCLFLTALRISVLWRNALVSIGAGTAAYMVLVQTGVFGLLG